MTSRKTTIQRKPRSGPSTVYTNPSFDRPAAESDGAAAAQDQDPEIIPAYNVTSVDGAYSYTVAPVVLYTVRQHCHGQTALPTPGAFLARLRTCAEAGFIYARSTGFGPSPAGASDAATTTSLPASPSSIALSCPDCLLPGPTPQARRCGRCQSAPPATGASFKVPGLNGIGI